jgi:hypothetical protein
MTENNDRTVINIEKSNNPFLAFFELMVKIPIFKSIQILFILLIFGIIWNEKDKIFDGIINYVNTRIKSQEDKIHSSALQDSIRKEKYITAFLNRLLTDTGASRASLFEFHNGVSNLAGIPFIKFDETGEVVANSVKEEKVDNVNLSVDTIVKLLPNFIANKCYSVSESDADSSLKLLMQRHGTEYITACPVFVNGKVEPIGFVQVSWTRGWTHTDVTERVALTAKELGDILQIYLEMIKS